MIEKERILFQLFAANSMVFAFTDNSNLEKYLNKMLRTIPGVEDLEICLFDMTRPCPYEFNSKFLGKLSSSKHGFDIDDFYPPIEKCDTNILFYPIQTAFSFYGFIIIKIDDIKKFSPFDAVISNFTISVSTILENRYQKIELKNSNEMLAKHQENLGSLVKKRTQSLKNSKKKLEKTLEKVIQALAVTVELRDPYTAGHQYRVAVFAKKIAEKLNLPDKKIHQIYLGALIHDIGKIQVPQEILSFPGELSPLQREYIKIHPKAGSEIIQPINFGAVVSDIVIHHHERLDGSGYPDALKQDEIPLSTRIVSVADVFEAMISHRPYRPKKKLAEILHELNSYSGKKYDPNVVNCCIHLVTKENFKLPSFSPKLAL